jgi:uncharacterized membrane protein YeaQ/YmgE (transglycosylase-associated protein family)
MRILFWGSRNFWRVTMDGIIFGLIDNGILIIGAYTGLEIDRFFDGRGALGAVIGGAVGNTVSDFVGALADPTMSDAIFGIVLGCVLGAMIIPVIEYVKHLRSTDKRAY